MATLRRRSGFVVVGVALGLAALAASAWSWARPAGRPAAPEGLRVAAVKRADVRTSLTLGGTVESASRTLIESEAERMAFGNGGQSFQASGNLTILYLAPEGSEVRKGDILCELDASDYEEMVVQQQVQVEEERADQRAAELKLQTAQSALMEFEEGLRAQATQELEGKIVLAESNLETSNDRLEWSERMATIGYVAPSKLTTERLARLKAVEALRASRRDLEIYREYETPKARLNLEGEVEIARSQLAYQTTRLARHTDRLKQFRHQVDLCTIRAPHDGFLIYANEDDGEARVEEGSVVTTKQDLFYLPDMDRMQVLALVHESKLGQVRPGMRARVWIEALPDRELEGQVQAIDPLPHRSRDWKQSQDVKNFVARIDLHATPRGLRPGMSAGVELAVGERPGALVIPIEALAVEEGEEVCYVAGADGVERRLVAVSPATSDLLCVDGGLEEGEEVVLDPEAIAGRIAAAHDDAPAATGR